MEESWRRDRGEMKERWRRGGGELGSRRCVLTFTGKHPDPLQFSRERRSREERERGERERMTFPVCSTEVYTYLHVRQNPCCR